MKNTLSSTAVQGIFVTILLTLTYGILGLAALQNIELSYFAEYILVLQRYVLALAFLVAFKKSEDNQLISANLLNVILFSVLGLGFVASYNNYLYVAAMGLISYAYASRYGFGIRALYTGLQLSSGNYGISTQSSTNEINPFYKQALISAGVLIVLALASVYRVFADLESIGSVGSDLSLSFIATWFMGFASIGLSLSLVFYGKKPFLKNEALATSKAFFTHAVRWVGAVLLSVSLHAAVSECFGLSVMHNPFLFIAPLVMILILTVLLIMRGAEATNSEVYEVLSK